MGRLSQMLKASTGSYDLSFVTAGVLLIVGCGLTLTLREGTAHQLLRDSPLPLDDDGSHRVQQNFICKCGEIVLVSGKR